VEAGNAEIAEPAEPGRRWGTALALALVVLLLSVFNALPLVMLPLAVLLVAIPSERRAKQAALGVLLGAVVFALPGGPLGLASCGWGLLIGGLFLLATIVRPEWRVMQRALATVGVALLIAAAWLAASGEWAGFDAAVREHFTSVSALAGQSIGSRMPDSEMAAQWTVATERIASIQWLVFPAVLALESLAALALAAWFASRVLGADRRFAVRSIRDFRFGDQLVWLLIGGLILVIAPAGEALNRVGYNALTFMAALYALRGVGVFAFLGGAKPSLLNMVLVALVTIFLYPLVLSAAVLVGLSDTWLDVRARAAKAKNV
jgi:hypothetical protein